MMLGTRQAVRCRGGFHQGGFNRGTTHQVVSKRRRVAIDITVPEFAMPPDAVPGIAQVIVDVWQTTHRDQILERDQ